MLELSYEKEDFGMHWLKKVSMSNVLNCYVFQPAFSCLQHLKAGRNTFLPFLPFFVYFYPFQWFHGNNQQKTSKMNRNIFLNEGQIKFNCEANNVNFSTRLLRKQYNFCLLWLLTIIPTTQLLYQYYASTWKLIEIHNT